MLQITQLRDALRFYCVRQVYKTRRSSLRGGARKAMGRLIVATWSSAERRRARMHYRRSGQRVSREEH